MKNTARKSINNEHGKFIHLVRAHHTVKRCYLNQQHQSSVSKSEKEFRHNPWSYAQKRLQSTKDSVEPSFNVSTAMDHIVLSKIVFQAKANNFVEDFTNNRCKSNRAKICWIRSISSFINQFNMG